MTVSMVIGAYMLVGCALASWAWLTYAKKKCWGYGPIYNAMIFVVYAAIWPVGLVYDWRRLVRNLPNVR